jgi:hypothetical protein
MPSSESSSSHWVPADGLRFLWYIQTYRDLPRLNRTLARVRTLYASSHVFVVSDGDEDPEIRDTCGRFAAGYTLRSRLFLVEHGGESVHQMLQAFAATDADFVIKIDPDTNVRRRFSVMPNPIDSSIYGTVQSSGIGPDRLMSIQGGCIIIPRRAATLIVASGLLKSERLKPPALAWAVNKLSLDRAAAGLTSQDWTLGWACRELGLACRPHPEVYASHRRRLIDAMRKRGAAVSHPRFEMRHLLKPGFYDWMGPLRRAISRNPSDATSREF